MKKSKGTFDNSDSITRTDFRKLVQNLGNTLTKATGEKVKLRFYESEYQSIKKLVEEGIILAGKQDNLKKQTLPYDFKLKEELKILDGFVKLLGADGLKDFVSTLVQIYDPEQWYYEIITDRTYIKQKREALHKIIFELNKKGTSYRVDDLLQSYGEVIYGYTQLGTQLAEEAAYIMKKRKRITYTTAINFLEIYKSIISGYVEHMIVFLYGIQQILGKDFKPYSVISKQRTSDQIKSLKKDSLFRTFVMSYRNDIRNSIIHGTQHIDRTTKHVHFMYKQPISLSYLEFISHVQEITKDAIMVANLKNEMNFLLFLEAREKFSKLN